MNQKYNKQDILVKGEDLFRKQGYHHTGINQILEACEIPKGSFYNFFKNKEDFGAQVLDYYGDLNVKMLETKLNQTDLSPLERLKAFYHSAKNINAAENFRHGCLVNNLSLEISGLHEKLRERVTAQFNRFVKIIANCITEGQNKKEFIDHYPAEELAIYLHSGYMGSLAQAKATRSQLPIDVFLKIAFDFLEKN